MFGSWIEGNSMSRIKLSTLSLLKKAHKMFDKNGTEEEVVIS